MKIKVTKKHIKNGQLNDGEFCPIALAIKDKGYKSVFVGGDGYIEINYKVFKHNQSSLKFMANFDRYMEAKPTVFVFKKVSI